MKTIASFANGAITVTEDQGKVSLNFDKDLQVGGGEAAGIIEIEGKGSIKLNGEQGLKLAEALLNAHLPAAVLPLAQVVEGVVNQAIKAIE